MFIYIYMEKKEQMVNKGDKIVCVAWKKAKEQI